MIEASDTSAVAATARWLTPATPSRSITASVARSSSLRRCSPPTVRRPVRTTPLTCTNGKLSGRSYGLFLVPEIAGTARFPAPRLGFPWTTNDISTAMRRALKRADDGKTLDPAEAEVLLDRHR